MVVVVVIVVVVEFVVLVLVLVVVMVVVELVLLAVVIVVVVVVELLVVVVVVVLVLVAVAVVDVWSLSLQKPDFAPLSEAVFIPLMTLLALLIIKQSPDDLIRLQNRHHSVSSQKSMHCFFEMFFLSLLFPIELR